MAPTYHPVWVYVERGVEMLFSRQDQTTLETDRLKGCTEVLGRVKAVIDFSTMSLKRDGESLPVKRYITMTNYIWVVSFKQKEYPLPLKGCILFWILYEKYKGSPLAVTVNNFISGQDVPCIIQFHSDESKRPHLIINQFSEEKGDLIIHETVGIPMRDAEDALKKMRMEVEADWENMRALNQYPPPPPTLCGYEETERKTTTINSLANTTSASIRNASNRGYVRPTSAAMKDKPTYTIPKAHATTEAFDKVHISTAADMPTNQRLRTHYIQDHGGRGTGGPLVGEVRQRASPSHPISISPPRYPTRHVSVVPPRNETDFLIYVKLMVAFLALFLAMKEWV